MSEPNAPLRWWLLGAVSLLAVLLLWFGALGAGPAGGGARPGARGGDGSLDGGGADDPGSGLPSPTGPAPSNPAEPAHAPAPTEPPPPVDGVLVVVVTGRPAVPVPGAEVWWLRETPASLALRWGLLAEPLLPGPARTDAAGCVTLPWGEAEGERRLVATAPGLRCTEARAPARGARVVLRLEPGLGILGRVEDPLGRPLAGIEVLASAVRRPGLAPGPDAPAALGAEPASVQAQGSASLVASLPMRGAEAVRAVSDEEGRVRFEGLSPGAYVLRPTSPGLRALSGLSSSTLRPTPGAEGLVVEAGEQGARLVLGEVRGLALHVVGPDGRSLPAAWIRVTVLPEGGGSVQTFASYAAAPSEEGDPAFVLERVLRGPGDPPEATVEVSAEGHLGRRLRVPLAGPDALPARPPAGGDDAGFLRVALEPERAPGGARLRVGCRRTLTGVARPSTRVLTLCRVADGLRVHRRATAAADPAEPVLFEGLPEGEAFVEIHDGLSASAPVRVVLEAGATAQAEVVFPELSGVVLVLGDAAGDRVFDADAVVLAPPGRDRGLPDHSAATRLRLGDPPVVALEPGPYRYAVHKRGVGYDAGTLTVPAGRVVTLEVRLGPLKRFFAAHEAGRR